MARGIKRGGKIWIRVFPDKPITKKPQETRRGKGKGAPEGWVVVVKPGRILFEMEGVCRRLTPRRCDASGASQAAIKTALRRALPKEAVMKVSEPATELSGPVHGRAQQRAKDWKTIVPLRIQKSMGQTESANKLQPLRRQFGADFRRCFAKRASGPDMANAEITARSSATRDEDGGGSTRSARCATSATASR